MNRALSLVLLSSLGLALAGCPIIRRMLKMELVKCTPPQQSMAVMGK